MKKLLALFLTLLLIPSVSVAEEAPTSEIENVVKMVCIVKLPEVIREGLYTGETVNGIPHGYGIFTATNSEGLNWHYLGEWANGCVTGQGGMYWDNGQTQVGIFENGNLICGEFHYEDGSKVWLDMRPNEQGHTHQKYFRSDNTVYMEGYYDAETGELVDCTLYTKNEEVFFKGMPGDGFDWGLIYIE